MKIAILGAGKLGIRVTEAMVNGNHDIIMVDTNEEKLADLEQKFDIMTELGDARTISLLNKIDIAGCDFVLASTGSDEINIISASLAKSLGCKKVVARVTAPEHMNQIDYLCEKFHIDAIVNPDQLITAEIYRYLVEKYSLSNGVYTSKRIALLEFPAENDNKLIGTRIMDFRKIMPDSLVVGISRHGKIIIPHGNDEIQQSDILYLVGEKKQMIQYSKLVTSKHRNFNRQRIMIIGGGRTGYFLAKRLSEYGSSVKIVENNYQRCQYLSENLNNVMVLHGNGTDINLLIDENIDEMDAFVTATGFDEENLLLALTAKEHGVEDVIAKISHENFEDLVSQLGVDIVLNPMDISASAILRMISGNKRVLTTVLLQGQAELLEIYTDDSMSIVGVPIKDLNIPDYAIIAAINRGTNTIIPDGDTIIEAGDHVIIVCLLNHIGYIEKLTN